MFEILLLRSVSKGSLDLMFQSQGRRGSESQAGGAYFNVEVLVDLDGIAEEKNVLHQTRELPHVPQLFQCFRGLRCHLWLIRRIELGHLCRALVARHGDEGACS